jgi:hypothetical protein
VALVVFFASVSVALLSGIGRAAHADEERAAAARATPDGSGR